MIVERVPTVAAAASYGHEKTCVIELAYKVLPSALNAIPWFRLFNDTNIFVEVTQPSVPTTWYEMPLLACTTSMLPLLSNWMLRGFVKPPATFVAFHPLARELEKPGFPAPEHEAGIAAPTLEVLVVLMLVTTVLPGGTTVALAVGTVSRLLATNRSKLSMRAALRSCVHFP